MYCLTLAHVHPYINASVLLCSGARGEPAAAHPARLHAGVRRAHPHARPRLHRLRQRRAAQGT